MDNASKKAQEEREEKLRKITESIATLLKKAQVEGIDLNAETKKAFDLFKCFDEDKQEKVSKMVLEILKLQPSAQIWAWLKNTLGQAIISDKSIEEIEEDLNYSKIKIAEKLKSIKEIADRVEEIVDKIVSLDAYLIIMKEKEKFDEIAKSIANAMHSPNHPFPFFTESTLPPKIKQMLEEEMKKFPEIKKAAEEISSAISKHDEELNIYAKKLIENRMAEDPEIRKVVWRGFRALEQLHNTYAISKALLNIANKF